MVIIHRGLLGVADFVSASVILLIKLPALRFKALTSVNLTILSVSASVILLIKLPTLRFKAPYFSNAMVLVLLSFMLAVKRRCKTCHL